MSVALVVANLRRIRTARMQRFVFNAVHRSASLVAAALALAHIVTSLRDRYAPIRLVVRISLGSAACPPAPVEFAVHEFIRVASDIDGFGRTRGGPAMRVEAGWEPSHVRGL